MLHIRTMRSSDIPFAVRLCDQEHWGVTSDEFRRLLRLDPTGCFVAVDGTRRVGLATSTTYGKGLAWIGNIVVDRKERGREIGRRLVEHAVVYLHRKRVRHVALYCFKENARFYKHLGFVVEASFIRLARKAKRANAPNHQDLTGTPQLSELLRLDRKAFGADRSKLLRLVTAKRTVSWVSLSVGEEFRSYLMVRRYVDLCELGPWISSRQRRFELTEILHRALNESGGLPIEVSVLTKNRLVTTVFRGQGFRVVRKGYRMLHGEPVRLGEDRCQCVLGFLDKG